MSMVDIVTLPLTRWDQAVTAAEQAIAIAALERGGILLFPQLRFTLNDGEQALLRPDLVGKGKNISLDPATGAARGSSAGGADLEHLQAMMSRFAAASRGLMRQVLPHYEAGLQQARTSFRPAEIAQRKTSWRGDDTRLHVDSFPSSPTHGQRILRVFSNINPHGQHRSWRVGEPFEQVARHLRPHLRPPTWGADRLMQLLGITKSRRTAYDHYMLQLHDRMKADADYQAQVTQSAHAFEPGSSWIVYTDLVSHAAMRGQYALEQTYTLPVQAMQDPARSPLKILETMLGERLA